MKYLDKFNESSKFCLTCYGSGIVSYETNLWGQRADKPCEDCRGTGKFEIYQLSKKLEKFKDDSFDEMSILLEEYDIKHGFIGLNINKYSEDIDDIESVEITVTLREWSTLTEEFFDEIRVKYLNYKIHLGDEIELVVTKLY